MKYHSIILHEYPDLDAILSSWLMIKFGEEQYSGVANASLVFMPMHTDFFAKGEDQIKADGFLALDIGGGKFDNHASKVPTSSAMLVANALGIGNDPSLKKLLNFVHHQDVEGRGLSSRSPIDHAISFPNILRGLLLIHKDDFNTVVRLGHNIIDSIYAVEKDWLLALDDYNKKARVIKLDNGTKIIGLDSASTSVMKVGRFKAGDVVIHRNVTGNIGITITKKGKCDFDPWLLQAARFLRTAEMREINQDISGNLDEIGLNANWFLHESCKLLSNGSPKASTVPNTSIPFRTVVVLVAASFSNEIAVPQKYCSDNPEKCPFCLSGNPHKDLGNGKTTEEQRES